ADLVESLVNEMFTEIPIVVTASPLAECFLLDWSITNPLATTSQVETLDVENQAFFEKNVQLLSSSLANLAEEQTKMAMYERNAGRKGDDKVDTFRAQRRQYTAFTQKRLLQVCHREKIANCCYCWHNDLTKPTMRKSWPSVSALVTRAPQAAMQCMLEKSFINKTTCRTTSSFGVASPDIPSGRVSCLNTRSEFGITGVCRESGLYHPGDTLTAVQEENKQLRSFLQTLSWPRLTGFEAHGKLFQLPVSSKESSPSEFMQPQRLSYLAGFFDGDGCVTSYGNLSGCTLKVDQSFVQPEILLLFRDTFGGSILRGRDGTGLIRPTFSWQVCGNMARRAAHLLSPHSIIKKRQLLLAATWPDEQADRQTATVELRSLKQHDSAVVGSCSWEYFTGFFDADGHVGQKGRASLCLQLSQKHSTVLHCLQGFLQSECGVDAPILSHREEYMLKISGTSTCKLLLHEMLQAGLICKAKQAETAIRLTLENCDDTRAALAAMVGNQRFGQRLDKAGVERAFKIRDLQRRVRCLMRRGEVQEAEAKLKKAADMKEAHQLLNAQQENRELLQYINWVQGLQGNLWQVTDRGTSPHCLAALFGKAINNYAGDAFSKAPLGCRRALSPMFVDMFLSPRSHAPDIFKQKFICVTGISITDVLQVSNSKTTGKIEPEEVLEALGPVTKDEATGMERVEVKAAGSGKQGFVTLKGNQGTTYLQEFSPFTDFCTAMDKKIEERLAKVKSVTSFFTQKVNELAPHSSGPLSEAKAELMKLRPKASQQATEIQKIKNKVGAAKKDFFKAEEAERTAHLEAKERREAEALLAEANKTLEAAEAEGAKATTTSEALVAAQGEELMKFATPATVAEEMEALEPSASSLLSKAKASFLAQTREIKATKGPMMEAKKELTKLIAKADIALRKVKAAAEAVKKACKTISEAADAKASAALRSEAAEKGVAVDELFAQLAGEGNSTLSHEALCKCLLAISSLEIAEEHAKLVCRKIEAPSISKRSFLAFVQRYYVVTAAVAITGEFEITK
ncbi:unnamed protein product, partial [Symbiodinium sp. CCMP2456]